MGLSVTAMAEEANDKNEILATDFSKYTNIQTKTTGVEFDGTAKVSENDVWINISPISEKVVVYRVDVEWDSLVFTYDFVSKPTWNPDDHTYSGESTSAWQGATEATVTVTNHSNASVSTKTTFADGNSSNTLKGVKVDILNGNASSLASAEDKAFNAPELVNVSTIKVDTTTKPTTIETFKLGTVNVTISAN